MTFSQGTDARRGMDTGPPARQSSPNDANGGKAMGQIEAERDGRGVLTLWLSNPGRRNALSNAMVEGLCAAFAAAGDDPDLRIVVLRGREGVFCAGRDLNDLLALQDASPGDIARMYDLMEEMHRGMVHCPLPVVAVAEGYALGIGAMLVTWADIALGAEECSFGYPEVRHGIVPYGAVPTMLRAMPHRAVMDLLLTGRRFGGAEAVRLGILSEVAPAAGIGDRLSGILAALLAGRREAQIGIKRFARTCEGLPHDAAVAAATRNAKRGTGNRSGATDGMAAFLQRRG